MKTCNVSTAPGDLCAGMPRIEMFLVRLGVMPVKFSAMNAMRVLKIQLSECGNVEVRGCFDFNPALPDTKKSGTKLSLLLTPASNARKRNTSRTQPLYRISNANLALQA